MAKEMAMATIEVEPKIEEYMYFGLPHEVIARIAHCEICGSHLHFTHMTDFAKSMTTETAKCPECGIRIRRVFHRLQ